MTEREKKAGDEGVALTELLCGAGPISSAAAVKRAVKAGWELWYLGDPRTRLPGRWELRWRNHSVPVLWDAITVIRRNLSWWAEQVDEIEDGPNWIYRAKQAQLQMPHNGPVQAAPRSGARVEPDVGQGG